MMRWILLFIIIIHALIHLLGTVKAFGLAEVPLLTMQVSKTAGMIWGLGFVLLIWTAGAFGLGRSDWWIPGGIALLVSQGLIFFYWRDAWAGTLANVILVTALLMAWGADRFRNRTAEDRRELIANVSPGSSDIITTESWSVLPLPVQRWLERSGVAGSPPVRTVRLSQDASMQMKPGQNNWMDARAEQTFTVDPPGFIWSVHMQMNPAMQIVGRDVFREGRGTMKIRMNGIIPLVDAAGDQIDEGSLQRYLGETVWFPTAALDPRIRWEDAGPNAARATLKVGGTEGSGVFYFNESGDMVRFEAMRYYGNEPGSRRYPWVITSNEFASPAGLRIPVDMEATWRFEDREWTWLKLRLDSITYTY